MSNLKQNNSNTKDLLNRTLSLIKAHTDQSQKLSEEYTNLQKAYSNHIRSKTSGTLNCAIELEDAKVLHETSETVLVRTEERDKAELMFENLMGDEPVEKLLDLWNVQNKEEVSSEGISSQFSHQPKYKLRSQRVMVPMVLKKQQHSKPSYGPVDTSNRFKCHICNKVSLHKGHLNVHMRVHSDLKPFGCTICPLKFSISCNLETHMQTHSGLKPFGCTICSKKISQSGMKLS